MKIFVVFASLCFIFCSKDCRAQEVPNPKLQELQQHLVSKAIDRGVSFMQTDLRRNADMTFAGGYPMGFRALYAYALLESGVSPENKQIKRLMKQLSKLKLKRTYSVSLYAMALDAYWRASNPPSLVPSASLTSARKSGMNKKTKKQLKKLIDWLVATRTKGKGVWGYGPADRQGWNDNSNTQFAILALQVGLKNQIKIPKKVWSEFSLHAESTYFESSAEEASILIEGPAWWGDRLGMLDDAGLASVVDGGFSLYVTPYQWGYKGVGSFGARTYQMTAAITSCLMVARNGFESAASLDDSTQLRLDELICGGITALSQRYESLSPAGFMQTHNNYYYTLYSFEKAMDLGGIEKLDNRDWYKKHAENLLVIQSKDGSWGTIDESSRTLYFSRVSTAFALLFLNRATQNLTLHGRSRLVTGSGKSSQAGGIENGRAFVPSLNAEVELSELFSQLSRRRSKALISTATEVLESIGPLKRPYLLPYFVSVVPNNKDIVDRFVQVATRKITGLGTLWSREAAEQWLKEWKQLSAWGRQRDRDSFAPMLAILSNPARGSTTRKHALRMLGRLGQFEKLPLLIECFSNLRGELAQDLSALLESHTSREVGRYYIGESEERRQEVLAAWRAYWAAFGEKEVFLRKWDRLQNAFDNGQSYAAVQKARLGIIALGPKAIVRVERILKKDEFKIGWLEIYNELTGQNRGL